VVDTAGMLVECCAANLFWRKGHQVFTPDLTHSGVAGIMRQRIISVLQQRWDLSIEEVSEAPQALSDAEEVIICNALMPILPVKKIENWHYNDSQLFDFLTPYCL